ncbi:MAG: hypothetical protein U0821_03150 [Chloroflexota bacterium]
MDLARVALLCRGDFVSLGLVLTWIAWVEWPLLVGEAVYARSDTFAFFFPVFAELYRAVTAGRLPMWSPGIFSGFPLLAEGQIGALYPPHLLAVLLAPTAVLGFLYLRVAHVALAGVGAYVLCRALGSGAFGASVGSLAFSLGSFMVAQQHHASLTAGAAWLPWVLAWTELSFRVRRLARVALLALAAASYGIQILAGHPQPPVLTGELLAAYVLWRQLAQVCGRSTTRSSRAPVLRAFADGFIAVGFIALVGLAIGAVQLLPQYELSRESWRAAGWSYRDAIEYSLPPINLITLIFPYFFRTADGGQWSLWLIWEVCVYVGIAPLALALMAVVGVRGWQTRFFLAVAMISLIVSIGGYLPFGFYERLWSIPPMQLQRAPARFSLAATLSLAVLAAYGAAWLARRPVVTSESRAKASALLALSIGLFGALVLITAHLVIWRAWLRVDRAWSASVLDAWYVRQLSDPLQALTPLKVHAALEWALDLANPKTSLSLGLIAALSLLAVVWREWPRARRLWQAALFTLVAADLSLFASDFHPLATVEELTMPTPAAQFLIDHRGPWRSLTHSDVESTRPNQLLPFGALEASGYSPLELDRHRWYAISMGTVDNTVLDLSNSRFLVQPNEQPALPSYRQVGFHPARPLMIGGANTPNGIVSFRVPGAIATEVRAIIGLANAAEIAQGEVVSEWVVTDAEGIRRIVPLRAGIEIADWAHRQPGARVAHAPAEVAAVIPVGDPSGRPESMRALSLAESPLARRTALSEIEYRHVNPRGQSVLYGVAVVDAQTSSVSQFFTRAKYQAVHRDADATIFENGRAFPRAYLVASTVAATDGPSAMARMMDGPFDPYSTAVVEGVAPRDVPAVGGTGTVDLIEDVGAVTRFRVTTLAPSFLVVTDAWYPGWIVQVDGASAELARANFLFRGVWLEPGTHDVTFTFDPQSFVVGSAVAAVGWAVVASCVISALVAGRPWDWPRSGLVVPSS